MPEIDYDAEIRRTRSCDTLTAVAWAQQQEVDVRFTQAEVLVIHPGYRSGAGATLAAAVLDCVLHGAEVPA